jgi:hypothetical protein
LVCTDHTGVSYSGTSSNQRGTKALVAMIEVARRHSLAAMTLMLIAATKELPGCQRRIPVVLRLGCQRQMLRLRPAHWPAQGSPAMLMPATEERKPLMVLMTDPEPPVAPM